MWFETENVIPEQPNFASGPPTGLFENFAASQKHDAVASSAISEKYNLATAYDDILKEVNKGLPDRKKMANPYARSTHDPVRGPDWRARNTPEELETRIWRHLDTMRASDDTAFADLPRSVADFKEQMNKSVQGTIKEYEDISSRANTAGKIGQFGGHMYAGMREPATFATLSIGAGAASSILKTAVIEALVGGSTEFLIQPDIQIYRQKLGLKRENIAEQVGYAAAGGALFGAGPKALVEIFGKVIKKPTTEQQAALDMVEAEDHAMNGTPFELSDLEGDLRHSSHLSKAEEAIEQGKLPHFDDVEAGPLPRWERGLSVEERVKRSSIRVQRFIDDVWERVVNPVQGQKDNAWTDLAAVSNTAADRIQKALKIDIHGYRHSVTQSELRHWYKQHLANPEAEIARNGAVPTVADLRQIGEILENFDQAKVGQGIPRKGAPNKTIELEKTIDGRFTYILEVLPGREKLQFITLWKRPLAKKNAGTEVPAESLTRGKNVESSTLSITPEAKRSQQLSGNTIAPSDVVVTPRGTRVPVKYEVVELDSLITSHGDDLQTNPKFPAELQPRDRSGTASGAQIQEIAGNLNPELLGKSATAGDGAPIIGLDHIVEAGNGRTLALRKAYQSDDAKAYRQWLSDQGYETGDLKQPVLVRRRLDKVDMESRSRFARESNERSTMDMRTGERAAVDAANMKDDVLELYQGGDLGLARNHDFVRAFMEGVAPSERANLIDKSGALSAEGLRRIKAAVAAKAYEDADMLGRLLEVDHTLIKSISNVLIDVAPLWAKLRGAVNRGDIAPDMDVTDALLKAVKIVDQARTENRGVKEILDQIDLFDGEMPKQVERFLRMIFSDGGLKKAVSREKLTDTLESFLREAGKNKAGSGLFDDLPPLRATEIMDTVLDKRASILPTPVETNAKAATKALDEFDELDAMDGEIKRILNEKGDLEIPEGNLDIETGSARLSSMRKIMDDVDLDDAVARETELCVKGE